MASLYSVKWSGDGLQTDMDFAGKVIYVLSDEDSVVLQFTKKSALTKIILL